MLKGQPPLVLLLQQPEVVFVPATALSAGFSAVFLLAQQPEVAFEPATALSAGLPAAFLLAQQPDVALVAATALRAGLASELLAVQALAFLAEQHAGVSPLALEAAQAAFCSGVQLVEQSLTAPNDAWLFAEVVLGFWQPAAKANAAAAKRVVRDFMVSNTPKIGSLVKWGLSN